MGSGRKLQEDDNILAVIVTKQSTPSSRFLRSSCCTDRRPAGNKHGILGQKSKVRKWNREVGGKGSRHTHLGGVAGFAGRDVSNHHVYQARCTAKDLRTCILQEGFNILAKDGRLQVDAKLIQHLLHTAFVLGKNLQQR